MVFPDLRDDRSLAPDDLGMKLWIYGHGDLETAQGLKRETRQQRPQTLTYLYRALILHSVRPVITVNRKTLIIVVFGALQISEHFNPSIICSVTYNYNSRISFNSLTSE